MEYRTYTLLFMFLSRLDFLLFQELRGVLYLCIDKTILLLSAKVFTSLYELGLTLLTRYQPFLLPLSLLLN